MKYKVSYYFDGHGEAIVEAKTEEEAEDKFYDGDYSQDDEDEWGDNYCIDEVNCIDEEDDFEAEQGEKAKQDALEQANKSLIN